MSRSRLSPLILLILFLVQIFAGSGEARGPVWCFGAGGEVRLENLPQGSCDSGGPCADESPGESQGHDHGLKGTPPDHCGDCLDLPALSLSASFRHPPRFSTDADLFPVLPPLLPAHSLPPLIPEEVEGFRPLPLPPDDSPHLVTLRTVVLRN